VAHQTDRYAAEWWHQLFQDQFLQPLHMPSMGVESYVNVGYSSWEFPDPGERRQAHKI
jgi:hypothetical protein